MQRRVNGIAGSLRHTVTTSVPGDTETDGSLASYGTTPIASTPAGGPEEAILKNAQIHEAYKYSTGCRCPMHLSPEQIKAANLFLEHETFACYDPQGAGKTAVAINAAVEHGQFPVLIVLPAHLIPQWRMQLELWGVPAEEIATAPRGCGPAIRHAALQSDCAFTLVSYNTLASYDYMPECLDPRWKAYVFDESHRMGRNGKGQAWHHAKLLRTKSRTKHTHTPIWLLSGTPLVKNAVDVWPLLFLVNKYKYGNRERFARDTCHTYQGDYSLQIGAVKDTHAFHQLLGQHSIRRSWREIPSLAGLSRRDVNLPLELAPKDLNRHREIKRNYRDPETGEPLNSSAQMIHALRRLTISAKVEAVTEFVQDHPGRLLLLAWYRSSAHSLATAVSRVNKVPIAYVDGGTPERQREHAFSTYSSDSNCIFVGTIGSMAEGWDGFQRIGHQVLFAEQHYLSATNEQAVARVLRRGQSQPVLVYWMYALKSFDMRVRRVAKKRQADIDEALGEFLKEEEWRQ